jgi:hypothetical protein
MSNEPTMPNVDDRLSELRWRVELSALYHDKRERFFDGFDRFSKLVSFIGGAAAFSFIKPGTIPPSGDLGIAASFAAFISLISGFSLVYQFSTKARRHAELARDFKKLAGSIMKSTSQKTDEKLFEDWTTQLYALESSEPARLGALVTHCHNELCTAHGHNQDITPLPYIQKFFKNYFDFDQTFYTTESNRSSQKNPN